MVGGIYGGVAGERFKNTCGGDREQLPETHPPQPLPSNRKGGEHNLFTHFPKDPNCEICRRTKISRALCTRNPEK